jgi:hypothetical protein
MLETPNIAGDKAGGFHSGNRRDHQIRHAVRPADAAARSKEIAISAGSLAIEREHAAGEIVLEHRARRLFQIFAAAAGGQHGDPGQYFRLRAGPTSMPRRAAPALPL